MIWVYCFCPVCLSVTNFNLCYNFWTVKDGDLIFGMHTSLMMPFQVDTKFNDILPLILPFII